jgi:N4-gp56 family major capsid protein
MAVNLATKYESKIAEAFTLTSLTEAAVNKDFSWLGSEAIKVFGITTQALTNYNRTATSNRFGTPAELQNVVQTMLVNMDRAFSISIDSATIDSTNGAIQAGKVLKMQIAEQVTPEIDIYRIRRMYNAAIANSAFAYAAVTSSNAYTKFLAAQSVLGDAKVPQSGRVAFISYTFLGLIKQDSTFMLASEVAMNDRINGMVGMVDGVKLIPVPSTYLAPNVSFILTHPMATVAAEKLTEYNVRTNVQGFSGVVLEGRVRYDAFVINQKVNAIYVQGTALIS